MRTLGSKNRIFLTSPRRRASIRRARLKRETRFLALGLTTEGTPRKTQKRNLPRCFTLRQKQRRYSQIYRDRLAAAGLSTYHPRHGQPLTRPKYNYPPGFPSHQKRIARQANYRARNVARGLTTHGSPRKPARGLQPSPLELKWREFRSTLQRPEPHDWLDFVTPASELAAA